MACLNFAKNVRKWRVRWRATYRKTHRIFSGSKTFLEKADAVRFFADIEQQERMWRQGQVPGKTIVQVLEDFSRFAQRFTKRTQGHYEWVLKSFVKGLPEGVIWIQQIKADHIREYLSHLLDNGLKNRTCNAHLTAIKSFCRYLYEFYDIHNPSKKIRMLKEDPPKARFLIEDEYQRILEAATPLARDRIIFLANTGLRASEFATLNYEGIDLQTCTITVIGKGRKRRTIGLNSNCLQLLIRPFIYKKTTRNALQLQFSRLAKKAGIERFGPHALRHYFATQLLLAGVPIVKVSMLMGHASVTTTQACYSHILPEDLLNVTDVLAEEPSTQDIVETTEPLRFPIVLHRQSQVVKRA